MSCSLVWGWLVLTWVLIWTWLDVCSQSVLRWIRPPSKRKQQSCPPRPQLRSTGVRADRGTGGPGILGGSIDVGPGVERGYLEWGRFSTPPSVSGGRRTTPIRRTLPLPSPHVDGPSQGFPGVPSLDPTSGLSLSRSEDEVDRMTSLSLKTKSQNEIRKWNKFPILEKRNSKI